MRTRVALAVALVVLLAGIGPAVGVGRDADRTDRIDAQMLSPNARTLTRSGAAGRIETGGVARVGRGFGQYKVSIDNVTIRTWLLRDATVRNATVRTVVVRNATTTAGSRTNVTLRNVTVGTFVLERAKLQNVTADRLVVRNRSVLDVPGGDLIDPKIKNRTLDRHWTKNATVSGVVIDHLVIDAAFRCGNATVGPRANETAAFSPIAGDSKPDITVRNGAVGSALVIEGRASNWTVGSMNQSQLTDGSLPQGCGRA